MKPDEVLIPQVSKIPAELKKFPQWVCWEFKKRNGNWTKEPHCPKTGQLASTTDPSTWGQFFEAYKAYSRNGKYAGVGFVLTDSDPFVAYDLDHCWTELGASEEVVPILQQLNSYTENSPSAEGLRVLAKGELPETGRKKGNFEVYDSGRYVTITGHIIPNAPDTIEARQDEITKVHKQIFGSQKKTSKPKDKSYPKNDTTQSQKDDIQPVLEKAFASKNGDKIKALYDGDYGDYPSQSEADLALACHLSYWLKNDFGAIDAAFRKSALMRDKWDSKRGASTYGAQTIDKAIEGTEERAAIQAETSAKNGGVVFNETNENMEPDVLNFPPAVLKGVAGKFARLYANHLEAPAHFFFMCFLTCLGSVLGNRLTLATEIAPQPRLYTLLLGSSADVRKSTAIKKVVSFFKSTLEEFSVCWGVGSAEGLQKRLKQNSSLLLCLDEFKQFISKCKIEASVLLPFVNTLYESNSYESWTKKSEIVLDDVYLSLLSASTIATYERTWDSSFTDIGFNNRLFIVPGDGQKRFSFPSKLPTLEVEELKTQVGKLLHHASYQAELDLTDGAKQIFQEWYLTLDNSIHAKRLDQYALRFAALLAVNNFKKIVDGETIKDVISICDWQLEVRQLHDPIDADTAIAKMEERIRRVLKRKPRTERELKQYTHANKAGLRVYQWAKTNLTEAHEMSWDKAAKRYIYRGV